MRNHLQFLLIMSSKLLLYGFFLQIFFAGVLAASNGKAQNRSVKEVFVEMDARSASILEIFKTIEKETEFSFIYDKSHVDRKARIDISGKLSVNDILVKISRVTDLRFRQVNNLINVKKMKNAYSKGNIEVVFQNIMVTGTVTDNGEGIPGVNVRIKDTNLGTITNSDGRYSLEAPADGVLIFSFVGYQVEEIPIANRNSIDVSLVQDIQSLEEVIVVGFGEQRKISFTGAQSSIPARELDHPVANISTMLAGRLAGITGVQESRVMMGRIYGSGVFPP